MEENKKHPYVLAYTMGYVGVDMVLQAMRSLNIPCHRCHHENIEQYHYKDAPTITMIREPISWHISREFDLCLNQGLPYPTVAEFRERFLVKEFLIQPNCKERPEWWFDMYHRPITGVNISRAAFDRRKKWKIYSIRALLLRTDALSYALPEALKAFLPFYYPDVDFDRLDTNYKDKEEELFGEYYNEFIAELKLPLSFLRELYRMQFWRTFFHVSELKDLVDKWKE